MDSDLSGLAAAQSGLLTSAQAHRAGVDRWGLRRLVRGRELLSVTRGVYAVWTDQEAQLGAEARHLRLAQAMTLLYPDCRLAGHTALVAMGLPTWGADLSRAQLERPVSGEVLTQAAVIRPEFDTASTTDEQNRVQAAEDPGPNSDSDPNSDPGPNSDSDPNSDPNSDSDQAAMELDPARLPAVAPALAVIQHTLQHGAAAGVVAADAALHRRMVDIDELERLASRVRGWPRSSRAQTMLAHADDRSESVGESRLRFGMALLGVELTPQVPIRDERGVVVARVDFLVAGTNVVVEFDGLVKYREGGSEALIAEKRREDELRRLGYVVVRVVWSELNRLGVVAARVRAAAFRGKVALHPRTELG